MGIFFPECGMYWYRSTRSAVIRSSLTQAGGGAGSTASRYHPFIRCQASWWSGESNPGSRFTSSSASSVLRLRSPFNIALMAQSNLRMILWYLVGSHQEETLSLTILHMVVEIHAFFPRFPVLSIRYGHP